MDVRDLSGLLRSLEQKKADRTPATVRGWLDWINNGPFCHHHVGGPSACESSLCRPTRPINRLFPCHLRSTVFTDGNVPSVKFLFAPLGPEISLPYQWWHSVHGSADRKTIVNRQNKCRNFIDFLIAII